jgi:hypothetical protein
MRTTSATRLGIRYLAVAGVLAFGLEGCAYRLPVITPPSQERVRIIAKSPDRYVVRVDVGHITDYLVPADGRIAVGIPASRPGCGIYLFNAIKVGRIVGRIDDPLRRWAVAVTSGSTTVRKLSLKQMKKLITDSDGYRLLEVQD